MKKIIFSLFVLSIFLISCQEDWKNSYTDNQNDDSSDASSENLLEYLKTVPEYSEFVKLLETTKVSEELSRQQVLTIWAPTNATMPAAEIAAMTDQDKVTLCRNHINYVALYAVKLSDKTIKMLSGKNLTIAKTGEDKYTIDGKNVVKLDQKCQNGVIHELDNWLVPRKSIFEYLLEAGPDYSIIRDSILTRSDTIFKPNLSFPLGVDELGNTIYDSVFIIENSLLRGDADLRSEDEDFTFFLPTNKAIQNMYQEMGEFFVGSGTEFTQSDSNKFFRWILNATIHEGKINTYAGNFESVYGYEWRAEKQLVKPDYKNLSNGYVYDVEKIHIPKFLYMTSVKSYPAYLFELDEETRKDYYTTENVSKFQIWVIDGRNICQVDGPAVNPGGAIFEFKTLTKDRFGNLIDGKVLPGLYTVKASYRKYKHNKIKFSINDEEVATINVDNAAFDYAPGTIIENFEVKEEWGFNMLRIKQEDVGKAGRLYMEYILLEPSRDNY